MVDETVVGELSYDVVWPLGRPTEIGASENHGLADLRGKKVALVWDYLFKGDEIFELTKEQFGAYYPGIVFVDYDVFGNFHDDEALFDQLPERLRELGVDATIVATGA